MPLIWLTGFAPTLAQGRTVLSLPRIQAFRLGKGLQYQVPHRNYDCSGVTQQRGP